MVFVKLWQPWCLGLPQYEAMELPGRSLLF